MLQKIGPKSFHRFFNIGAASFAQERIYLDQQLRFSSGRSDGSCIAVYNELTVLKITTGTISVLRLRQAIGSLLMKHPTLRTSIDFNIAKTMLIQRLTQRHDTFDFAPEQILDNNDNLHFLLQQINRNPTLFDFATGQVFYCQLFRQRAPDMIQK